MKRILLAVTGLLASSVFVYAQDALLGKWTGEVQGGRGGPQTMTLELKMDAGKLAGTLANGLQPAVALSDVKVDGTKITFSQVQNFNGNEATIAYSGEVKGDELTLTRQGGGGGRGAGGGGRGGGGGGGAGAPGAVGDGAGAGGGGAPAAGGGGGGGRGGAPAPIVLKRAK